MENVLEIAGKDVNASISLFGLSRGKPNNKTLYLLGKNDPLIDFNYRYKELEEYNFTYNKKLLVETYKEEGHWFRKKKNIKDAIVKIQNYYDDTREEL